MKDDDESEFASMIPGVKRLRNDRINVYQHQHRARKQPLPARRIEQDESRAQPSESQPARDTQFNTGLQKKLQRKIRQGLIRPEASLDLHGFRQTDALDALEGLLNDARRHGMRMILIIHGQGFRSQNDAVLKPLVQRWLANQPEVLAWCPALSRDGAAGASYVYLRGS
jgi:DNA-nicking Smr family endonuclease